MNIREKCNRYLFSQSLPKVIPHSVIPGEKQPTSCSNFGFHHSHLHTSHNRSKINRRLITSRKTNKSAITEAHTQDLIATTCCSVKFIFGVLGIRDCFLQNHFPYNNRISQKHSNWTVQSF